MVRNLCLLSSESPCAVGGQDVLALLQELVLSLLNAVNEVSNASDSDGRDAVSNES